MPPPLPSEPKPKPKFGPSRSHIPLPRQGTLDKFFNRSNSNLPAAAAAASSSSTTANKTPTKQSASRSTFAVVINSSPSKHATATTPPRTVEDDADDLVISDLSPQFRRLAAQAASGVSLAKPVLPDIDIDEPEEEVEGEAEATSSGATPQPQPKRRGRPKGSSNKTPRGATEGPRKLRPDRPKAGSMYAGKQKRRGRPPRAESPKPRAIYEGLDPHFNVFICEWQGCEAELHNFSTLKKHVMVVHARNSPFQCRWAKCAEQGQEQQPPEDFSTSADLTSHIEDLHMLPIAWQVGDGPQVSFKRYAPDDGTELPAYLFDKAGNQITPSIRDQREEDFISWRNNRRRLKDLLLLRDQNLPSEEEDNGMEDVVVEGE